MKGRETRAPSADLLVCFPTRSHLTLLPKPICSPARSAEPSKRSLHHHHRLKKSSFRGGGGGTQSSPMLWSKTKQMGSDISEPTSPKVTCAGQIKVRPKSGSSCKNWQSVMEEIEKLHNTNKKQKKIKKPSWVEAIGFKKDVMQFLTCLRTIRFDFRCFGSFPNADMTTSSDDDEDSDSDSDENKKEDEENENESTKTVFSKWFMVLQENHNTTNDKEIEKSDYIEADGGATVAPPSNALLLMRCRSAPAKSWLEEKEEEEEEEKKAKMVIEEEVNRKKKEENLAVMRYDTDFYKLSSDIAKETWVVGGINKDPLSRSRSWKR